jgi:hypothetical protein
VFSGLTCLGQTGGALAKTTHVRGSLITHDVKSKRSRRELATEHAWASLLLHTSSAAIDAAVPAMSCSIGSMLSMLSASVSSHHMPSSALESSAGMHAAWNTLHVQENPCKIASCDMISHFTPGRRGVVSVHLPPAYRLLKQRVSKRRLRQVRSFAVHFRSLTAELSSSFDCCLDLHMGSQRSEQAGAVAEGQSIFNSSKDSSEKDLALIWCKCDEPFMPSMAVNASEDFQAPYLDSHTCADQGCTGPGEDTLVVCNNPLHDLDGTSPDSDTLHWQIGALQQGTLCVHRPDEHQSWANMQGGNREYASDGCDRAPSCDRRTSSPLSRLWRCMLCSDCADTSISPCSHCSMASTESSEDLLVLLPHRCGSPKMAICEGVDSSAAQLNSSRQQTHHRTYGAPSCVPEQQSLLRPTCRRQQTCTSTKPRDPRHSARLLPLKASGGAQSRKITEHEALHSHGGGHSRTHASQPSVSKARTGTLRYPVLSHHRSAQPPALQSEPISPPAAKLARSTSTSTAEADSIQFTEEIGVEAAHVATNIGTTRPKMQLSARQPRVRSGGRSDDRMNARTANPSHPSVSSPRSRVGSKEQQRSNSEYTDSTPQSSSMKIARPAVARQRSASACVFATRQNASVVTRRRNSLAHCSSLMQPTEASAARKRESAARGNLASIKERYDTTSAPEPGGAVSTLGRVQKRSPKHLSNSSSFPLPNRKYDCSRPASASAAAVSSHQRRLRDVQSSRLAPKSKLPPEDAFNRKYSAVSEGTTRAKLNHGVTIGKPSTDKKCQQLLRHESSRQEREEARRRLERDLSKLEDSLEHALSQTLRHRPSIPPICVVSTLHSSRDAGQTVTTPRGVTAASNAKSKQVASNGSLMQSSRAKATGSKLDCSLLGARSSGHAGGLADKLRTQHASVPLERHRRDGGQQIILCVSESCQESVNQKSPSNAERRRLDSMGQTSLACTLGSEKGQASLHTKPKLGTAQAILNRHGKPVLCKKAVQHDGSDSESRAAINFQNDGKSLRSSRKWSTPSRSFSPTSPGVDAGMWEARPGAPETTLDEQQRPLESAGLYLSLCSSKQGSNCSEKLSCFGDCSAPSETADKEHPDDESLLRKHSRAMKAQHEAAAAAAVAANRNGNSSEPCSSASVPAVSAHSEKCTVCIRSLHAVGMVSNINGDVLLDKDSRVLDNQPEEPDASVAATRDCDVEQTTLSMISTVPSLPGEASGQGGLALHASIQGCNPHGPPVGLWHTAPTSTALGNTRQIALAAAVTELEMASRNMPLAVWKRGASPLERCHAIDATPVAHRPVTANITGRDNPRDGTSDRMASTGSGGSDDTGKASAASTRLVQMQAIHDSLISLRLQQSPSTSRTKRPLGSGGRCE